MIQNVIFDMGNVLVKFVPELCMGNYVTEVEDRARLCHEIFEQEEWRLLDRGDLTEEEACKRICKRLDHRLGAVVPDILAHWHENLPLVEGMEEVAACLKRQGKHLFLLSNASLRFYQYQDQIPALRYFDGIFISADHHLLKPEPAIYQKALQVFACKAEESFFIDDMRVNIESAIQTGMNAWQFDGSIDRLWGQLEVCGIFKSDSLCNVKKN